MKHIYSGWVETFVEDETKRKWEGIFLWCHPCRDYTRWARFGFFFRCTRHAPWRWLIAYSDRKNR